MIEETNGNIHHSVVEKISQFHQKNAEFYILIMRKKIESFIKQSQRKKTKNLVKQSSQKVENSTKQLCKNI